MLYTLPDGSTVFGSAELPDATGCPPGYLQTLNHRAASLSAFTVRSLVDSFDREAFAYGSGVYKSLTWQDREAVAPALRAYFGDPYRVKDAPISALASEGFAPDAPLTDAEVTELLGASLARVADAAFKRAYFYDQAQVEAMRAGYAVERERLDKEAARNAAARQARKSRGRSQAEQFAPFTASA